MHPLSEELRELADHPMRAVWGGLDPYKKAIRRAADALDEAQTIKTDHSWLRALLRSVLSEDGVREKLSCYVMGVELMNMVDDDL